MRFTSITNHVRRRPRRRLSVGLATAVASVMLASGALAAPALASSTFESNVTPLNTFYLQLDVSGASTQPGAPVIDWYSNGGANQKWFFSQVVAPGMYEIANQNSGMCLTTDGNAGDQLYQEPCNESTGQIWITNLSPSNSGYQSIQSAESGLYLDVYGNTSWPGASIDTWYWNGGSNQKWALG
ncbi:MAG TPA: RICIN domain-containing protein [Solirubrobacteraceae bacterium]|nr:RICIN domain-containing protein [Solirubrobacteraceae bacterium]